MENVKIAKLQLIKEIIKVTENSTDTESAQEFKTYLCGATPEEIVEDGLETIYVLKKFWELFE